MLARAAADAAVAADAADVEAAEAVARVGASGRFTIQWHITEKCNCRCSHCYQTDFSRQCSMDEMSAMLSAFHKFFDVLGVTGQLTITGGEPLLHPDIWSLLRHIREAYPHIGYAILSNGTTIDRETAARLKEYKPRYVQVSVEGKPATHDSIRGAGNYKRALTGIDNLCAARIPVSVSFTAHGGNYRELPQVARLASRHSAIKVWSDRMVPWGEGSNLDCLDANHSYDYFRLLNRSKHIAKERALQFLEGGRPYRCTAGESLLAVVPDGTVYPCRRLPIPAGNVWQESLSAIYESDLMKDLRNCSPSECGSCLYTSICRGGLRCLAYAINGDYHTPDPGCPIAAGIYRIRQPKRRFFGSRD